MSLAFTPVTIGEWQLPQRFVMAPLTRSRVGAGGAPTALNATYYGQRASAGLIISEGVQPSAVGQGYLWTPGLHTPEQVAGWRLVADAVHAGGGRIVAQLMHVGRVGHADNRGGLEGVAPSAIAARGVEIVTAAGKQSAGMPRALESDEIPSLVGEFARAAENAVAAGLDGVELHAANGYLLHQFLAPSSNQRTDAYGGSPAARARFVIEVASAVASAIGAQRVGIRISPAHNVHDALELDPADTAATYAVLVDALAPLGLAYLSILGDPASGLVQDLRRRFGGSLIVNSGFRSRTSLDDVTAILERGLGDAVAVGREFIANPDLVERWRLGAELNEPDPTTFYGGGAEGYIDYPSLESATSR